MKKFLLSLLFITSSALATEQLRVAVIDTGLDLQDSRFSSLICDKGLSSIDLTNTSIKDSQGHGTHVVGLIKQYAQNSNYCLIIIKYYLPYSDSNENTQRSILAFKWAIDQKVDIVNYSAGGENSHQSEKLIIENAKNIIFIVASGNEGKKLDDIHYCFYPACYDLPNIIVVGSLKQNGIEKAVSSNYGQKVKAWEIGENVLSTLIEEDCGKNECHLKTGYMSGTSMATAIHTGKVIFERLH